ncbi:MAG: DUF2306 domain-containing protein [Burkholderiaceae bacterium]
MRSLTPLIAVHMTAAITATVIGPFAMWARLGMTKRPKLHRAFGYAWVTMMIVTAVSAIFISSGFGWNWYGFSPIHVLVPLTLASLFFAFRSLIRGNIAAHKKSMISLYVQACLIAGFFTFVPGRFLGDLLWK